MKGRIAIIGSSHEQGQSVNKSCYNKSNRKRHIIGEPKMTEEEDKVLCRRTQTILEQESSLC